MPGIKISAGIKISTGIRIRNKETEIVQSLLITSTGADTSPLLISMFCSGGNNSTITLGPNATFYDDADCTRNASRTWVLPVGETPDQRYLICALGSATFTITNPENVFSFIVNPMGEKTPILSGNLGTLGFVSANGLYYLEIYSNNTLSGNLSGLDIKYLIVTGNTTISCDVTGHNYFALQVTGNNTVSGEFSTLASISSDLILSPCAMTAYTSGVIWPNQNITINPSVGYGYSSTEIDNMLIDMANFIYEYVITLQGANAWRTSASDAAVSTLVGNGCTVFTNGILLLTARGNGSAVQSIILETSENTLITLGPNARFYSNSAGTLDASQTWNVISGAERQMYLKCTGGTATFEVQTNTITRWVEWTNVGSPYNSPEISGNIGQFTNLTQLTIGAYNSLSVDMSALTNLQTISIGGGSMLSGDISGLTNLIVLYIEGNTTLTGSVAGLTNLTNLEIIGYNTLSGNIAGLTSLIVLNIEGNNTLTGSIAGLMNLQVLTVGGNNTLTGSIAGLTNLQVLIAGGNNTISGDISSMLDTMDLEVYLNPCAMTAYTNGSTWPNVNVTINPSIGYGYSSEEIDNMLVDMANSGVNGVSIILQGASDWRTTDSDAAMATLVGNGCTVFTNGILLITSLGSGTDLARLILKTSVNTLITLGPNARFYSDAAGTLDESQTWNVISGAERTMYVKCTGGTATFDVQTNTITMFDWWTNTNNSPSIGGDIGGFTSLTFLGIVGDSTISGDVSRLTNLEFLDIESDTNTISGNVAGLTNLSVFVVTGNSTISGSIAGLTSLDYLIIVSDYARISGSVTNLINLINLILVGNNITVSGSVAGLTSLTALQVSGTNPFFGNNNTLSGSINSLTNLTGGLYVTGNNTISGDVSLILSGIGSSLHLNSCAMTTYTNGATWPSMNVTINPSAGYGYPSTIIDNILIDMASTMSGATISLLGSSAPRTSASDAAVATLEGNGCTVNTNYPL
jgi:hypothetical protein